MPDEESLSNGINLGINANAGKPEANNSTVDPVSSPQGYQRLASMMAEYPANAIFRHFGFMNALNLLYYQAELTQLEIDLWEAAKLDRNSSDGCRQLYFRCYESLSRGKIESGSLAVENMTQWNLVLKMRSMLKEYSMLNANMSIPS